MRSATRKVVLLDFQVRDEFVAPELSIDGTAFSLNSLFQRIYAAHSMSTAEAGVQARLHALIGILGQVPEHRDSEYLT